MATMEQMAAALTEMNNRLQAQETELQGMRAAAATGRPTNGPRPGRLVIDSRQLSKPEVFKGDGWREWSTVFRSYAAVANAALAPLLRRAEQQTDDMLVANAALAADEAQASWELHHLLINITRGPPLTLVVNAGEQEGLRAWAALVQRYEPRLRSRQAGQLMELLKFHFTGDVLAQLSEFEKEINLYCANTSENFSDRLRCGIVIANLPSGPVRDHMLLHVERLGDWASFRVELEQISRVQQFGMFQSTAPMDVGQVDVDAVARGKGGKGKGKQSGAETRKCYKCGKTGHLAAKCYQGDQQQAGGGKGGAGAGGKGGKGDRQQSSGETRKCYKCGRTGHLATNCRSVSEVAEENQAAQSAWTAAEPEQELHFDGLFITQVKEVLLGGAASVGGGAETVTFGVDSGAECTVVRREVGEGYPVRPRAGPERKLRNASGGLIAEYGDKHLAVKGTSSAAPPIQVVRATTAAVSKNLLAVADLVDAGHRVVFSKDVCVIKHETTGRELQMRRRGRAFEVDFAVVPYEMAKNELGKRRSGNGRGQ